MPREMPPAAFWIILVGELSVRVTSDWVGSYDSKFIPNPQLRPICAVSVTLLSYSGSYS